MQKRLMKEFKTMSFSGNYLYDLDGDETNFEERSNETGTWFRCSDENVVWYIDCFCNERFDILFDPIGKRSHEETFSINQIKAI